MANQASTSMADSVEEKIKDCHNEMVIRLCDYFSPKLKDKWEVLLQRLTTYLKPVDLYGDDNSFIKICNRLMALEIIDCGSYDKLYEVIRKIDAEAAKIIKETSEGIKDIRSKGQRLAEQQRTDEGVGKQHFTEFRRRIAAMIERTKAMIEEDKKSPFIATKGFKDAKEKFQKNRVVVIKGNSGDGKTTTAIRLILGMIEEQHGRQPIQLYNINDLDSLPPKSKLITFIDDIFGKKVVHERDVGDWNERIKSVLPTLCGDPHTEANFLLITIRNEVFNSLKSHSLENVFVDSNIIDLSSDDYKIKEEMLELLESYKPENVEFSWEKNEKDEIIKYATCIGFPQCCRLFRDCSELHKERVKFFKMPFHFLNRVLEKLAECNAILFLFLNGGEINAKNLDPNGKKVDKTLLGEAFDIDLKDVVENRSAWNDKKKIEFVRKSLDTLSGFLVVKEKLRYRVGFVYKFAHDSIYSTVERLYRQITPTGFIRHCPTRSLSLFTISKSASDGILLTPDNYVYLFERILRAWDSKRYYSHGFVCFLDVWTDGQFIEMFFMWLNDNDIDKVDVLNKACHGGVKPFVLYLLSRGVKPNENTNWWSLMVAGHWGHDVDMDTLQKVIKYMNDKMKRRLFNKACSKGFVVCALYLLSEGVKTDKDTDWWSLLISCWESDKDTLQKVIKCMNDEMKLHLLNKACSKGVLSCASYLLFEGVKPDKDTDWWSLFRSYWWRDKDKNTLQKVIKYMNDEDQLDLLNKACSKGVLWCALYLLSEGVKPNRDTNWWSLVTRYRRRVLGNPGKLDIFTQQKVAMDILQKVIKYMNDEIKLDFLNKACSECEVECVLYLLSEGVKPDKDTNWWSLVTRYQALYVGFLMKVNMFPLQGVDMDILQKVMKYMNDEMKLDLLNKACSEGDVESALYLLSEGVKPNEDTDWWSLVKRDLGRDVGILREIDMDILPELDMDTLQDVGMDTLQKVIKYMNDEMKIDLLNKACSEGGDICALYLLSEGVKPDKDTDFRSLVRRYWGRDVAMDSLKKVIKYMNDELKLELLNKACSEGGIKCALYLLSEGVKPDKDTDWWSLVTRYRGCDVEMDILKKVIIYMNDEMKLDLLNKACCSSSDECVKYLLSEDVECEENTPFCVVKTENIDMLRNIVFDINDETKLSLLNVTCYKGLEECALYLLSKGGKPDNNTPFCVVWRGCIKVMCKLVKYDVIPTVRSKRSKSSNKYVSMRHVSNINVLHEACLFEREEMVTLLCNAYPELVHDTDAFGHSPLLLAALTGNGGIFHTVETVILKTLYRVEDEQHQCESVDGRVVHRNCMCAQYMSQVFDLYGGTILNVICVTGHIELCVYMCQSYPELAIVENKYGTTVLHSSIFGINGEICKYLCQLYPVLTAVVDSFGRHILHYMARFISDISLFSECEILVKQYLESIGQMYDITTILDNNGRTMLHHSCEGGNRDLCVYLCQTYPKLTTAVDKVGRTALHVSCERRDREICKYLCETFPELTTAVDKDGGHCLHYLAKNNRFDFYIFTECQVYVKRYLESLGLKYDIKTILNNRGQSVLDVVKDESGTSYPLYRYLLQFFNDEV